MPPARRSIVPVVVAVFVAVLYSAAVYAFVVFIGAFAFWGNPDLADGIPRFHEFVDQIKVAVVAFDIVLVVGTYRRWRYVVPASALLLLVAFVIGYRGNYGSSGQRERVSFAKRTTASASAFG